ncbi:hypothetical protein F2Q69_00000075 [Brassica cretica]|uniref:PRA1 family protein n=1 Tax=Brassica cretica TaxID=69181 RepID=A0A8S9PC46_BRACR|nr:hypothetical protein F2Q69_00000075 [Brassica cretica]
MDWGNVTAEDLVDALREVDWSSPPRPLSEFFSRFTVPKSLAKWDSRLKCNLYYYRTNYFIMIVFILGLGFLTRPLAILSAFLTAVTVAFLNDSFAGSFSEKATRTIRSFSPQLAAKMRPPLAPVIRGRPSAKRAIYICGQPRWVFVLISSLGPPQVQSLLVQSLNYSFYRTNYFIMIVFILGLGFLTRPLAILSAFLTAVTVAFLNDSFAGSFSEKATRTIRSFSPQLAAKMRPPLAPVIRGRPSAKRAIYICGQPRWVFVLISSLVSFALWYISCGLFTVSLALLIGLLATILHATLRTPNLKARLNTFREEFRAVWRNYSEI